MEGTQTQMATVEMFTILDLVEPLKEEKEKDNDNVKDKSKLDSSRSEASSIRLCVSPDPDSDIIDINSNLTSPMPSTDRDENPFFDRHRRRSSRLAGLKSELVESGAIFRPPFTPSNSLTKISADWKSREQVAPAVDAPLSPPPSNSRCSSRMRSASVRPGSDASSAASNTSKPREPSLPPMKNRYAHVRSRVDSHSVHKAAPSQVRILNKPIKVEAKSRVGSLANIQHTPGGGDKKIPSQRLDFKAKAHPKIDFGKKENGSAANSRPTTPSQSRASRSTSRNSHLHSNSSSSQFQKSAKA